MVDNYINPTAIPGINPTFGSTDKYNVPPFVTPFPFEQQKQENKNLISGYTEAIKGQETLPALQQRYENRYFIPQLREQFQTGREAYQDVLNEIRAIPENVKANTRESLVTEGQRSNIASAKYQKLEPIAQTLGQTVEQVGQLLTEAEQNMNSALALEVAQQKKELEPWEWNFDLQTIMQAREMTGWSQTQSMELSRLLKNASNGLEWDNSEAERANRLALAEAEYRRTMDMIKEQADADIRVNKSNPDPNKSGLSNYFTGI